MDTLTHESLANLRHELRTPINHILGYCDFLIEDAEERHLAAFVPVFKQILNGGHRLFELVQAGLGEDADGSDLDGLKKNLLLTTEALLEICSSLQQELESEHSDTVADLDTITTALRRLREFGAGEGVRPSGD